MAQSKIVAATKRLRRFYNLWLSHLLPAVTLACYLFIALSMPWRKHDVTHDDYEIVIIFSTKCVIRIVYYPWSFLIDSAEILDNGECRRGW